MILRLSPDQVSERWDNIKGAIEQSLPPILKGGAIKMENILEAIVKDVMHCWVMEDEGGNLAALATTTFMPDPGTKLVSLFIYTITAIRPVDINEWRDAFAVLAKWGKSKGCANVIAFTDVDRIVEIAKSLGGTANQILITLPIGGE